MPTKPTKNEMEAKAREIAQVYADRMVAGYASSVGRYMEEYDGLPDTDDFFAWLEGYEWHE